MKYSLAIAILWAPLAFPAPSLDPPKLRLDGSVQPLHYQADLTIVPDRDTFHGSVDISVDVRTPADVIWLNSIGMQVQDAAFRSESGDTLPAKTVPGGDQFLGFVDCWGMGLMLNTYNCPMGHFKQPMGLVFESRVELHQPTKMVINRNSTTVVVFPKVINRNRG